MNNKFKSDLSIAKNIGSGGCGAHHWLQQRFTAVFLILSTIWLFCFTYDIRGADLVTIIEIMQKPYHMTMLLLTVLVSLYHSVIGMQVIIEDYISCRMGRILCLWSIQIFSIITACAFIIAVLYVMTL